MKFKSLDFGTACKNLILLTFILFGLSNCSDVDDDFYSFGEAGTKIMVAYAAKDAECGSSRQITSLVPGKQRKKDVDNCVASVAFEKCSFWTQAGDPVPFACKAIEYRLK
ncbi:LIC13255 family lipoprotein [Leptospira sp. SA-E8]|uniref:LIC13255 family lipoprotein n=1 Tax=Leptospira sp. SA-E8 TaxID=3422259 RepID=UPI003EBA1487